MPTLKHFLLGNVLIFALFTLGLKPAHAADDHKGTEFVPALRVSTGQPTATFTGELLNYLVGLWRMGLFYLINSPIFR